ncbi:MAG: hypothetical protein H7039_14280 [Bryobacteraceae bacterium]|nr:hypothetical protein [Bryobacteraceae bacterium]
MSHTHITNKGPRTLLAGVAMLFALFSCVPVPVNAQETGEVFQATLTKASNIPGSSAVFMDLPVPPPGQRLTLKRVSVKVGPAVSIYTQIHACYIESDRPKIPNTQFLETRTRVHLAAPEYTNHDGSRVWHVRDSGTLIHYDNVVGTMRTTFRLTCEGEAMGSIMPVSVTVVGHTTPLP